MSSQIQNLKHGRRFLPHSLDPHLLVFTQKLSGQGFTILTIQAYESTIAHFGTWLKKQKISTEHINHDVVADFAQHQCDCCGGRRQHAISGKYIRRVQRFVDFLGQQGVTCKKPDRPKKALSALLLSFIEHLRSRGLSPRTLIQYEQSMSKLLPLLGQQPKHYTAQIVRQVICDVAKRCSRSEAKKLTKALRAYLRFLAVEQLSLPDLDRAVPTVAQWSLSSMPRYITREEIERVINACDRHTHKGLRDRAVVLLLARIGLRAGDIIQLRLDDINWSEGTLRVIGKGKREDRLPLPQEAGDAVLAYINTARPAVSLEHVFLCLNAPFRPFASSPCVSNIVAAALIRAGISNPPSHGAHLLRHSAATDWLRSGASLETVSSMLRHRSLDMTAYYAKVDMPLLKHITQPWPEGGSC